MPKKIDPVVADDLERLLDEGWTDAGKILDELRRRHGKGSVSRRSVYRALEARRDLLGERWSVVTAGFSADEQARILRVTGDMVIGQTRWTRYWPSVNEAHWIARISTIAPDLDSHRCTHIARRYVERSGSEPPRPTDDLDLYLGTKAYIDPVACQSFSEWLMRRGTDERWDRLLLTAEDHAELSMELRVWADAKTGSTARDRALANLLSNLIGREVHKWLAEGSSAEGVLSRAIEATTRALELQGETTSHDEL